MKRTFRFTTDQGHHIDVVPGDFEIILRFAGKEFEGLWVGGLEDDEWIGQLLKLGAEEITI